MSSFRKKANDIVGSIVTKFTGCEMEWFDSKAFALYRKKRREKAWFSNLAQLRSIIEKFDINIVIDAGANEGQFVKQLRSFYAGEIFSFEPVSTVFEKLSQTASGDPKWHTYNLALGSQEATQKIYISDATVFSSLLKTNDYGVQQFGDRARGKREELISVKRLDALLDEITAHIPNKRIFLKMDTQGFDTEVFKGAKDKLNDVLALQSEVSLLSIYENMPRWTESISLYEQAGFGVVGLFPVTRDAGRVVEYDCLMAKAFS